MWVSIFQDGRVFKERLSSVNAKEEGSHSQQEAVVGENIWNIYIYCSV